MRAREGSGHAHTHLELGLAHPNPLPPAMALAPTHAPTTHLELGLIQVALKLVGDAAQALRLPHCRAHALLQPPLIQGGLQVFVHLL